MKGIFLTDDRYEVSAQIEKHADTHRAYFAIEDKSIQSKGHEIAIGIENGQSFIQVAHGDEIVSANLMDIVKAAISLKVINSDKS